MIINYHDDAWDYFDNKGGRDRFDLPKDFDIYNDVDYCLIIYGHNIQNLCPHVKRLWNSYEGGGNSYQIAELIDKTNGSPYTVVVTWHG